MRMGEGNHYRESKKISEVFSMRVGVGGANTKSRRSHNNVPIEKEDEPFPFTYLFSKKKKRNKGSQFFFCLSLSKETDPRNKRVNIIENRTTT